MIKKISVITLGLTITISMLFSQAAQFLRIVPGAKPASMGEAYTGAADDVYGVYYNPASAGKITDKQAVASYISLYEGMGYMYAAYAQALQSGGAIAAQIGYMNYGSVDKYVAGQKQGSISPTSMVIAASYGMEMKTNPGLLLGASAHLIQDTLESSANAFALDAGILYTLQGQPAVIGASISNLGSGIKFKNEESKLPMVIRAGVGYKYSEQINIAADISSADGTTGVHLGFEYLMQQFLIRAGYSTLSGISAGAGINLGEKYILDLAYVQGSADLGSVFKVSLWLKL